MILEPARLLGACKPGSRDHMDSRTGCWTAPLVITREKRKRNVFFNIEAVGGHFLWVAGGLAQSDTIAIEGVDSCS